MKTQTRAERFDLQTDTPPLPPATFGSGASSGRRPTAFRSHSRARLFIGDVLTATAGWGAGALLFAEPDSLLPTGFRVGPAIALMLIVMVIQHLYSANSHTLQSIEVQRIGRAAATSLGGIALLSMTMETGWSLPALVVASTLSFALVALHRATYRVWLQSQRRNGHYRQPTVLIGNGSEAVALEKVLYDHPESGFHLIGRLGRESNIQQFTTPWVGEVSDAVTVARSLGVSAAIVEAAAWPQDQLNRIVESLLEAGIQVHLSNGLQGVAAGRVSVSPVAYEPLLHVAKGEAGRWQIAAKRSLDVVAASVLAIMSVPVLAMVAVAIKLEDGGPVFFRQHRVGRDGRSFELIKLRTMVVGADQRIDEVAAGNMRSGPLFKTSHDRRVTRIGGFLRASSIDELPQLWNVLNGTMSLVGPRPALPTETVHFDEDLLTARLSVQPGVTGLWQVEARDNPSFGPYRRLDIYYVENWSVWLDVSILVATVCTVVARTVQAMRGLGSRRNRHSDHAAASAILE